MRDQLQYEEIVWLYVYLIVVTLERVLKTNLLILSSFCLSLSAVGSVLGASLGDAKVTSALGDPLKIEIPVAADANELTSMVARVGTMNSYQEVGLAYTSLISDLRARLDRSQPNAPVVRVFSKTDIGVPVFDLLIELSWLDSRARKSFTVFIDPPKIFLAKENRQTLNQSTNNDASSPITIDEKNKENVEKTDLVDALVEPEVAETISDNEVTLREVPSEKYNPDQLDKNEMSPDDNQSGLTNEFGPISSGDTLSKIAVQLKPDGVSLEQMLVLLYRKNIDAFIGENMNRLKVGPILELPNEDDFRSISEEESREIVRNQYVEWRNYKDQLSQIARTGVPAESTSRQQVTGSVTAEDAGPDNVVSTPKEVLRLSQDDSSTSSNNIINQVRQLKEELIAKDNAVNEANVRLAKLEKTIKDLQALIEVENKNLSAKSPDGNKTLEADSSNISIENNEKESAKIEYSFTHILDLILEKNIEQMLGNSALSGVKEHSFYLSLNSHPIGKKILQAPFYLFLAIVIILISLIGYLIFRALRKSNELNKKDVEKKRNKADKVSKKKVEKKQNSAPNEPSEAELKDQGYQKNQEKNGPDLSGIDLDLDSAPGQHVDQKEGSKWYEVQTKYDLAKAYQEMGDRDGALQILMEVVAEGDEDQKSAAKQTISELDQ